MCRHLRIFVEVAFGLLLLGGFFVGFAFNAPIGLVASFAQEGAMSKAASSLLLVWLGIGSIFGRVGAGIMRALYVMSPVRKEITGHVIGICRRMGTVFFTQLFS